MPSTRRATALLRRGPGAAAALTVAAAAWLGGAPTASRAAHAPAPAAALRPASKAAPPPAGSRLSAARGSHAASTTRTAPSAATTQAAPAVAQPAAQVSPAVSTTGVWVQAGPRPEVGAGFYNPAASGQLSSVYGNVSGRVVDIAVDPGSGGRVAYAGTAGGGVWKTTDGGAGWAPMTDAAALGSLSIGAVAVDPNNPQTVYAGTGEDYPSVDAQYGQGILKSTDGGSTWAVAGNSRTQLTSQSHPAHVAQMVVDRSNSSRVLVASDVGTWLSTDAGATWTRETQIAAQVGSLAGAPAPDGSTTAIVQDPAHPNVFYAAADDFCFSEEGDILASVDGGVSWTNVRNFHDLSSPADRIGLGIGPGGTVYVAYADCSGNLVDLEKTTNAFAGNAGTKLPVSGGGAYNYFNLGAGGQGWYDNVVAVDPTNAANVFFGGIDALVTRDGGASFTSVAHPLSGGVLVPNFHAAAFFAGGSLLAATDGGVWRTTDLGGTGAAGDWTNLNATLGITDLYGGAALDASHLLGGAQGTGSPGQLAGSGVAGLPTQREYLDGNGGLTALDPQTSTVFSELPGGSIQKGSSAINGGDAASPIDSFVTAAPCDGGGTAAACQEAAGWAAPFVMDQTVNDGTGGHLRLLAGRQKVYVTTASGLPAGTGWTAVSQDLTTNSPGPACTSPAPDYIGALYLGTTSATHNTALAATACGHVFMTTNAGSLTAWTDVTGTGLPAASASTLLPTFPFISSVAFNPANTAEAWLTVAGVGVGHVFHTTNLGGSTTWSSIGGSLPNAPALSLVQDPSTPGTVYAGTAFGAFVCTACGGGSPSPNWGALGAGLPASVQVDQLTISRDGQQLVAWTHGSGAYTYALGSNAAAPIFDPAPAGLGFAGTPLSGSSLQQLTVRNDGSAALSVSAVTVSAGGSDFAVQSNGCSGGAPAGGSCAVSVQFTPQAPGSRTGTLSITDSAAGSPHVIPLSGSGVSPLAASPASLGFGSEAVFTPSAAQPVTLTNIGTVTLTVTSSALGGANPGDFARDDSACAGHALAPNQSCAISASFSPVASGARSSTLSVSYTGVSPAAAVAVPLSGTGSVPTPFVPAVYGGEGSDYQLWTRSTVGSSFVPLGGLILSAPGIAQVAAPHNRLYVVVGLNHQLYQRTESVGFVPLTSAFTSCNDSPSVLITSTGTVWVACEGGNRQLYVAQGSFSAATGRVTLSPQGFYSEDAGAVLGTGPTLVQLAGNPDVVVFVSGPSGYVYDADVSQHGAFNPNPYGWVCAGHSAFATSGSTSYFGCNGAGDHQLYVSVSHGSAQVAGGFGATHPAGGYLINGPGVAANSSGAVYVVEGGDQGSYYQGADVFGNGLGFHPLGGTFLTGLTASL